MSHDNGNRRSADGLRPPIPAACRAFARALEDGRIDHDHVAACPRCTAHAAFRSKCAGLLGSAPPAGDTLLDRKLLEAIHERIVETIEAASPLGEWMSDRGAPPLAGSAWPDALLDSSIARAMSTVPASPSGGSWAAVRESVIADLGTRRAARTRLVLWFGAASIAAVALVGVLLPSMGTRNTTTIVFTDLDSAPGVDFSVVRYGALR